MPSSDPPPPAAMPTGAVLPVAVLHVCVTCRAGETTVEGAMRPGRRLFEQLQRRLGDGVELRSVECLARCGDGCTAAIAAPGKWSLLLGRLDADKAEDLLVFAESYRASRTGMVMPSRRPASLAEMILGRIPGIERGEPA